MINRTAICLLAALALSGCFRPFTIEVQQGNFVKQQAVDQLRPGMTRDQVRLLLGTPLIFDLFHTNRWDYVYTVKLANSARVDRRRVTAVFEGDLLKVIEGDVVAAASKSAEK